MESKENNYPQAKIPCNIHIETSSGLYSLSLATYHVYMQQSQKL